MLISESEKVESKLIPQPLVPYNSTIPMRWLPQIHFREDFSWTHLKLFIKQNSTTEPIPFVNSKLAHSMLLSGVCLMALRKINSITGNSSWKISLYKLSFQTLFLWIRLLHNSIVQLIQHLKNSPLLSLPLEISQSRSQKIRLTIS